MHIFENHNKKTDIDYCVHLLIKTTVNYTFTQKNVFGILGNMKYKIIDNCTYLSHCRNNMVYNLILYENIFKFFNTFSLITN